MTTRQEEIEGTLDWKSQRARAKTAGDSCGFCGRSRFDVEALIVGPVGSICSHCAEKIEDKFWEKNENRILLKVKIPGKSRVEDIFLEGLSEIIAQKFPEADIRYEKRRLDNKNSGGDAIAIFSIRQVYGPEFDENGQRQSVSIINQYSALKEKLEQTIARLSVEIRKNASQEKKILALENEILNIKAEYFDFLRKTHNISGTESIELRCVMFLDIVGFSTMDAVERSSIISFLRGVTPLLMTQGEAAEINMWGDAIVANCEDPNKALKIASQFVRLLEVQKASARIGMAWGEITRKYNPAIKRYDIEGDAVNLAARLEPLAERGTILVSNDFAGLDISSEDFRLESISVNINKSAKQGSEDDFITAFRVVSLSN